MFMVINTVVYTYVILMPLYLSVCKIYTLHTFKRTLLYVIVAIAIKIDELQTVTCYFAASQNYMEYRESEIVNYMYFFSLGNNQRRSRSITASFRWSRPCLTSPPRRLCSNVSDGTSLTMPSTDTMRASSHMDRQVSWHYKILYNL